MKAFTLVESLIVVAIIAILSLILFPNYQSAQQQLALQRSAFKLAQDIRTVQEMAMSVKEFEGEVPEGGYGISLSSPSTSYTIFADVDSDGEYDNPSEKVEDISLESGIEINSIIPASLISIIFLPPDPEVFFKNPGGADLGVNDVTLEIAISSDTSKNVDIIVNKAGFIDIE